MLEDHAFLLEALITLYEATFDPRWFAEARALADTILERFPDPENGGFFSTADDHEQLIARRKDIDDNPIPAGQSAACLGLLRLGALTGEHRYEEAALGVIRLLHTIAPQHPAGFGHLLQAIDFHVSPVREVALVGPDLEPLERVVRSTFRPHVVLAGGEPDGVPLLAGREPVDGRAAAYVCERFACRRPGHGAGRARRAAGLRSKRNPGSVQLASAWPGSSPSPPASARSSSWRSSSSRSRRSSAGCFSGKFEDAQENETASFLPGKAESVKSLEAVKRYPGGELAPAVIVYERDGGLTAADRRRVVEDQRSFQSDRPSIALPPQKPTFSENGDAALFSLPIRATGDSERFEAGMDEIRDRVSGERGGLTVKVTGAAGYGADAIKVFGNINGTLLGVTALVVLILLIIIYRSPIFWAIPFFTVLLAESLRARVRLPDRRGGRDDQRAVRRHPAGARVRRGHGLRAVAREPLSRGVTPPRGQARGDAGRAAHRRARRSSPPG